MPYEEDYEGQAETMGFIGALLFNSRKLQEPIEVSKEDRRFSCPTGEKGVEGPAGIPGPIFENRPLMASNTGDMGMCYAEDNSLPRPIGDAYPTPKLVDERAELAQQFEVCKKSTVEGVDFTPDQERNPLSITGAIKDIAQGDLVLQRQILQEKVLKLAVDNEEETLLHAIAQSDSDALAYDYFLKLRSKINAERHRAAIRKAREQG